MIKMDWIHNMGEEKFYIIHKFDKHEAAHIIWDTVRVGLRFQDEHFLCCTRARAI